MSPPVSVALVWVEVQLAAEIEVSASLEVLRSISGEWAPMDCRSLDRTCGLPLRMFHRMDRTAYTCILLRIINYFCSLSCRRALRGGGVNCLSDDPLTQVQETGFRRHIWAREGRKTDPLWGLSHMSINIFNRL